MTKIILIVCQNHKNKPLSVMVILVLSPTK